MVPLSGRKASIFDGCKDDLASEERLISRVRNANVIAKGNEAEMVHVVGFDLVARDEGSVNLRNGLFVALTRSRGRARLSGVGEYVMCDEMRSVFATSDTFTFTFSRAPRRAFGDEG